MESKYRVIGIMSGTSLDGLDIAYCEFTKDKKWAYKIVHAETKKYDGKWKSALRIAFKKKKKELDHFDIEYGKFIGREVQRFIKQHDVHPDFIASHGHTIFHQPEKGITLQIGNGASIASACKLPVVSDFRAGDVALGGQGAPLVPVADKLLFSEYDFCLNLGGFANVSYEKKARRLAFDICPVNIVLNELAGKLGMEYDKGGKEASRGAINGKLLNRLNALAFYSASPPKSLGREWVENDFMPVLNSFDISPQDKLRTIVEHCALQIAAVIDSSGVSHHVSVLITGGGAYNDFLIRQISVHCKAKIILPGDKTIQFKEAMAFAFLGVLKMRGEISILKSVTGAKRDSSGGEVNYPG